MPGGRVSREKSANKTGDQTLLVTQEPKEGDRSFPLLCPLHGISSPVQHHPEQVKGLGHPGSIVLLLEHVKGLLMGLESLLHLTGVDQPVAQTIEAMRVQGRIRERLGERYRLAKECPCAFILAPRPQRAQV